MIVHFAGKFCILIDIERIEEALHCLNLKIYVSQPSLTRVVRMSVSIHFAAGDSDP